MTPDLLDVAALAGCGLLLLGAGWHAERAVRAPIASFEPLDPEGPAMPLQRYRLHIYDGEYEVMHKQLFVIDVDLDSPTYGAILNRQFVALVELARIRNDPMQHPVMSVHDLATDAKIMDWVG